MAQRKFFNRDMIVDTAFSITREKGWPEVTARTIAKTLGSSTMPIYSELNSMQEIEQAVQEKAASLLRRYQAGTYTDNVMLNLAVGYVMFAKAEPELFHFLFVETPASGTGSTGEPGEEQTEQFGRNFGSLRGMRELFEQIPKADQAPFILQSWIFTHGMAAMVSAGVLKLTDKEITALLQQAGGAFYAWKVDHRENKNEQHDRDLAEF